LRRKLWFESKETEPVDSTEIFQEKFWIKSNESDESEDMRS
jgi:hypothetical protein